MVAADPLVEEGDLFFDFADALSIHVGLSDPFGH